MQTYPNPIYPSWTPFGLLSPYTGAGSDSTISVNATIANQVQQYRDLTINSGIVLTAGFSPQIIICRRLIFIDATSQISANGLGGLGGVAVGDAGAGGIHSNDTSGVVAATGIDFLSGLFADGGAGSAAVTNGVAGSNAKAGLLLSALNLDLFGCIGGGGGGRGRNFGAASGTGGLGGKRGGAGASSASVPNGSGGGSGVGGGGGAGGAGITSGAPGAGGNGGGVLYIVCQSIMGGAGLITANGANGSIGTGTNGPGGGGGGGGLILVFCNNIHTAPTLQVTGGSAGGKTGTGGTGGAGGTGLGQLMRGYN